jgi:hypothetical protein
MRKTKTPVFAGFSCRNRVANASLKVCDQLLALGQQPAIRDQAGRDAALDVLHDDDVLGADLTVERE